MKYYVYQLKRTENAEQPFYIGLTRDPKTRSRWHKGKHGASIQFAILHEFSTEEEAISKETELIKWHSEHGNIVNLLGVKGTRLDRKGKHQLLTAKRAEKRRLREARIASEIQEKQAKDAARKATQAAKERVRAAVNSAGSVADAFVVLRGLLNGVPTPKETALQALETIRLAPGAMELANVYIKANII